MMDNNQDKVFNWFKRKFWPLNSIGDVNDAFMQYKKVLIEKHNPVTNEKFSPEELLIKYKAYKTWHNKEGKRFVKGGLDPLASLSAYFRDELWKSDYNNNREVIPERDNYLFGDNLI